MTLRRVVAVVVHHRSYDTLAATLAGLLSEGIVPDNLLVVDNSEEPDRRWELEKLLPPGSHVLYCENSGYGAAVNRGAAWHEENSTDWQFVLVSTHESRPYKGCLAVLQTTLADDPGTAVVGPVLLTGEDGDRVWSKGGYLTRFLGIPRHLGHLSPRSTLSVNGAHGVSWLDGAFLMYRRGILTQFPICEDYFLYMEETDHHQGLRRHGWSAKISTEALAWQRSDGVPLFYLTRNIQLFHARNGSKSQALLSAPYLFVRAVSRDMVKLHRPAWRPLLSGLKEGRALAARTRMAAPALLILNPLGGALKHYTAALQAHLLDAGMDAEVRSVEEPSVSGQSPLRWLINYVKLLRSAGRRSRRRARPRSVLVTWPVLGFWDLLLVKFFCGRSGVVVYHDPQPMVRSIGSSKAVSGLIRLLPNRPGTLVHSHQAAKAMQEVGLAEGLSVVAHPVLLTSCAFLPEPSPYGESQSRPRVRVLGQYKHDRDLDLLKSLAARLSAACDLEIIGRGWPHVEGWRVDPRFIAEDELDDLISSSAAIVIPYRRFYQSGIAIRALEHAVPIVGLASTSLQDLYGPVSRLLVRETGGGVRDVQAWVDAVEFALEHGRKEALCAAKSYQARATRDWTLLARSYPFNRPRGRL